MLRLYAGLASVQDTDGVHVIIPKYRLSSSMLKNRVLRNDPLKGKPCALTHLSSPRTQKDHRLQNF